ncbi:MAG: FtsQ-type POTRA domain-containing protein [Oscillospiraceae bacterium]
MKKTRVPQNYDMSRQRENARDLNGERLKKRRKKNHTLHYILLFILTLVIGFTLSVTVFFNVEEINVIGNEKYTKEELIAGTDLQIGKNLFRISSKNCTDAIMKEKTDIDSVEVKKKLPNAVEITVNESKVSVASCSEDDFYLISAGGRVVDISKTPPQSDVILLYGMKFENVAVGDFVKNIKNQEGYVNFDKLINAINSSGLKDITIIDMSNEFQIKLYWQNRVEVNVGNMNDLEYKFDFAQEILLNQVGEGETGVLDVSKPKKGLYRVQTITLPSKPVASNIDNE